MFLKFKYKGFLRKIYIPDGGKERSGGLIYKKTYS